MDHHDQDMHSEYSFVYPYSHSSSSFLSSGISPPRFNSSSDAFGSPPRHEQHEAEHVYNSPPLALDPSTLNLRSNSNDIPPTSSSGIPSGSNSTTPTGSLRLATFSQSPNGVTTRRKARAALDQLHIHIDVGVHAESESEPQSQHSHRQGDMHDIRMQSREDLQIPLGDNHDSSFPNPSGGTMDHEQGQGGATPHPRDMYSLLPGNNSQGSYYLTSNPDGFSNSPISPSSPPETSPDPSLQTSPSTPASATITRTFGPGPVIGLSGNRSMPLIQSSSNHASPVQQQLSPSQHLSSHPHMHPTPYYPLQHQSATSPGFPSTPATSHHTQGSSSSSHSSGHTRYSFRGSPGPRGFGSRHARSSSFGTVSTMSVRSSSPANSVASAFTSLSGGGGGSGSAPASTSGATGSPTLYGEGGGDVTMPFAETSPPSRAQSHPPLSMPTAHPALTAYSALLPPPRKPVQGYLAAQEEAPRQQSLIWPPPPDDYPASPPRMTEEEFQAQFRPKPVITRAPHRKQKLANADRKAICMYAKQHPNARQEDIAARYNVERSTISKILKNKERWLGCPDDEAKVARKRKPRFDDLELVLKRWVEGSRDPGIILSDALIRSKAKEEARLLGISEEKFKASSGWLENFKHRVGIRKGKYVGREPWLGGGSDEEDEEARQLSQEELNKQRIVFMMDPPPQGYERPVKGFWRMPEVQRQEHVQEQVRPEASPTHADEDQGSGSAPPRARTAGLPMRKTRSRTLAEAREAALSGPSPTSPTALAPAAVLSSDPLPDLSSPAVDGREASAGLDVALDFIGCQPEGFATPEEVAVLQKLSRRMSRAEHPNWNDVGGS